MNQKKTINYSEVMRRVFLVYRIALVLLILAALFMPHAGAVEDMWTAANRIIKDVYTKIAGVSTVLAGLMSAVAVIGAKMSGTQQKAECCGAQEQPPRFFSLNTDAGYHGA